MPPGYNLNIPSQSEEPVKLGDYLDEVDAAPTAPRPAVAKRDEQTNVIELPRAKEGRTEAASESTEEAPKPAENQTAKKRKRKRKGPARKQINATPEAISMIEELIEHVQTYSVQKDAKASEVFHALVLALHEAREYIDLSEVPARGRWGTPTAKAFPISLKNAFQEAIATAFKKHRR